MTEYRFTLQKYKRGSKLTCPKCGRKQCFVKYVDAEGQIAFPDYVGRCDHEHSCQYHYKPSDYFKDNPVVLEERKSWKSQTKIVQPKPTDYIARDIMHRSLANYERNPLFIFLSSVFGEKETSRLFQLYCVGTSKKWVSYIKQRNGKMMRPILALLIAKLFGEINDSTLHAALSLELLHTASLVHDDVVDESDKRRGQSSVNAIYNNKVSVLVGDYMLATSLKHSAMTREITIVDLVACLGQNLSEGEIIQLANINASEFSEEVYYDVIRKKTAALFTASAEAGAISVHASDEMVKNARLFGEMIGIAFQIKDDIFDYYSSDEIGKPTGNDMREGKLTLPALYVLNMFDDEEMRKLALRIRALDASDEDIARFIEYTKVKGGIEYARQAMVDYRNKALALLPQSAGQAVKDALTAYIDYVIERDK